MAEHFDITLPKHVSSHIRKRRATEYFNFSSWISKNYEKEFMDDVAIIQKYNKTMKLALELKKQIEDRKVQKEKEIQNYNQFLSENPKFELEELRFLVSAKRRISKDNSFLEPNYKAYCNIFKFIPKSKFMQKLEKIDLENCKDVKDYVHVQDGITT